MEIFGFFLQKCLLSSPLCFIYTFVFDWLSGRQKRVNFRKNVLKSSSQETIWRMKPKLGILAKENYPLQNLCFLFRSDKHSGCYGNVKFS